VIKLLGTVNKYAFILGGGSLHNDSSVEE